jgi:hypothetical protein|tara:strand:- start:641 stop:958 length:318 start_codon:yes stop_codon:yes gene_type:complete
LEVERRPSNGVSSSLALPQIFNQIKSKNMEIKNAVSLVLIVASTVLITKIISDRYNELNKISSSVNELRYYINEDVFNGNLDEEVYEFYTKELYDIEQSINRLKK